MGCARLLLYDVLIFAAILLPVGARAESRLALIITNVGYPSEIGTLANPHKDGAVIAWPSGRWLRKEQHHNR
jgi:hypothetical protein